MGMISWFLVKSNQVLYRIQSGRGIIFALFHEYILLIHLLTVMFLMMIGTGTRDDVGQEEIQPDNEFIRVIVHRGGRLTVRGRT